jgi:hypothetical protein
MPNYIFSHPETGEIIEVFQKMNDEHLYVDKNGVKWNRIFTKPQASIDTSWNPYSESDWLDKTKQKKGNIGNILDKARELSSQREKEKGIDEKKEKYKRDWSKKRRGKKCPDSLFGKSSKDEVIEI